MAMRVVTISLLFAYVSAKPNLDPFSDAFIDLINSQQTTWKAGRNFNSDTTYEHIITLLGVHPDFNVDSIPNFKHEPELIASLPENFDPLEKWPNCLELHEIRDQGSCGSCWALGAVATMTDRTCTYSNGTKHFHISAEDLVTCCTNCAPISGCQGGFSDEAFKYWKLHGLVSGGNYNTNKGCRPYSIRPCNHIHSDHSKYPPCGDVVPTPQCSRKCEDGYNVAYEEDKLYAVDFYAIKDGEDDIMAELFKNGPVEASFTVYADFIVYKSGVYRHTEGERLGLHAVKIFGWGVENGAKYWHVANSWNEEWGDGGFFKILRGEDHCGIESNIMAGEPLLSNKNEDR